MSGSRIKRYRHHSECLKLTRGQQLGCQSTEWFPPRVCLLHLLCLLAVRVLTAFARYGDQPLLAYRAAILFRWWARARPMFRLYVDYGGSRTDELEQGGSLLMVTTSYQFIPQHAVEKRPMDAIVSWM